MIKDPTSTGRGDFPLLENFLFRWQKSDWVSLCGNIYFSCQTVKNGVAQFVNLFWHVEFIQDGTVLCWTWGGFLVVVRVRPGVRPLPDSHRARSNHHGFSFPFISDLQVSSRRPQSAHHCWRGLSSPVLSAGGGRRSVSSRSFVTSVQRHSIFISSLIDRSVMSSVSFLISLKRSRIDLGKDFVTTWTRVVSNWRQRLRRLEIFVVQPSLFEKCFFSFLSNQFAWCKFGMCLLKCFNRSASVGICCYADNLIPSKFYWFYFERFILHSYSSQGFSVSSVTCESCRWTLCSWTRSKINFFQQKSSSGTDVLKTLTFVADLCSLKKQLIRKALQSCALLFRLRIGVVMWLILIDWKNLFIFNSICQSFAPNQRKNASSVHSCFHKAFDSVLKIIIIQASLSEHRGDRTGS